MLLPDDAPTGRGIRVAVLDTGIDIEHPDLQGRVDLDDSDSFTIRDDLSDRNGHGTHVAGIIGGTGAASKGYLRGIAPECELVALKISETNKSLEWNAQRAVERAIEIGADIINYSNGYYPDAGEPPWLWSTQLSITEQLFEEADRRGVLCVVAAGNAGPHEGSISRPGGLERVLTVGAVDEEDRVLATASRGPYRRSPDLQRNAVRRFDREALGRMTIVAKPDIVAPGRITAPRARGCSLGDSDIELVDPFYIKIDGTSQATAVVTGLAALVIEMLREHKADLGPERTRTIRRLFCHAASKLAGHSPTEIGHGLVLWSNLVAIVQEFVTDPGFAEKVLADVPAKLFLDPP